MELRVHQVHPIVREFIVRPDRQSMSLSQGNGELHRGCAIVQAGTKYLGVIHEDSHPNSVWAML